jgi:hypothetical protein
LSDEIQDQIEAEDRRAAARGAQAEAELELVGQAFEQLKAAAIEEWLNTSSGQVEKREKLHQVANLVDTVRRTLMDIAANGKIARMAMAERDLLRP